MRLCFSGPVNPHTQRWTSSFAQRGHEVHLIIDEPVDYPGIIVHPLHLTASKNAGYFIKKLRKMRALLRQIQPDLLHTHYLTGEAYISALTGFHPYVVTIWGHDIYVRPHAGFDERLFTRYVLRRADLITADSQDQIEEAIKLNAPPKKTAVIQWGVNRKLFRPDTPSDIRNQLGWGDDPVVISQRRCRWFYNIDVIVHAFVRVLEVMPRAHLLITGGGELQEDIEGEREIKRLVRELGITDSVYFTGYLPYDALPAYIVAADVTVSIPSDDGTAMTLLEGMACGAAPIVTDLPSNREWITDGVNGYMVPPRDPMVLAVRIIDLLQNPSKRHAFTQKNEKLVQERADHFANMDRMEALYERLIARMPPRHRSSKRAPASGTDTLPAASASGQNGAIRWFGKPFMLARITAMAMRGGLHRDTHPVSDHTRHIHEAAQWLLRAQQAHGDGGCAKSFNLLTNAWEPSYPETSGYIIPTLLGLWQRYGDVVYRQSAEEIGAWLCSLQMEIGAFPWIDLKTPLVFDTGEILHGLVSLWQVTRDTAYARALEQGALWLTAVQEEDGAWIRYEYRNRPHTYNTQVSWALARAWQVTGDPAFQNAARRQLDWALRQQQPNGWFNRNSLDNDTRPILHTIVYTAQGLLEAGLIFNEERHLNAARLTASALRDHYQATNRLFGAYDARWNGVVNARCLTGEAQLSELWLRLVETGGDEGYQEPAVRVNTNLKRVQDLSTAHPGIRGGIPGSFPIYARYMAFKYPNWAVKYYIDSLLLEDKLSGNYRHEP